jgi:TP901 family phage tail tape measure protein
VADVSRTIEIVFGAVDNTGAALSRLSNNLDSVANNASTITGPLAGVADFALKAETAVLALAVAYGAYASVKAAEFETAQIDLNKVLSAGEPGIESFTGQVIELSEQYGISSAAILQGIANFKQAGFSAVESAALQKNALDLVIAGDIDAARASDILVQSLKGFGAEASEAGRFIEALNNVSNDYATDVAQLAEGMSRVAPIAKIMGFSFEEAAGLLTPIIEVFGSGSEAADALKTGLLRLIDDAKPVREALASLGISQTDLNGALRSGKDIFYDVANAFTTLDENQKLFFTQQLVGIDQAPRMVKVFDDLEKVNQITASAMAATGSVSKEVELRLASTAKSADIMRVSFDNLAISIGTRLNSQLGGLIGGSSDVLQAFRAIVESGGLDQFFEAIRPQFEAFSNTLANIAQNLPAAFEQIDFTRLISALKDLGFEFGGIFDGLDLNTVGGLSRAIQFLVDSFESLTRVTSGIVKAWAPVIKEFIAGIDTFNKLDDSSKKTFGTVSGLAKVFESLKGVLTGGFGALDTIGISLQAIAGAQVVNALAPAAGALGGAAAAALPLATALTAITIGVGGVAFGVSANISAWRDYKATQDTVADSTAGLAEKQPEIAKQLDEISRRTGIAVTSMDELNRAVDDGRLVFNEATNAYEAAGSGVRDYDAEVEAAAQGGSSFADAVNAVAASMGVANDSAKATANSFRTLEEAQRFAAEEMADSNNVTISYRNGIYSVVDGLVAASDSSSELGDATKKAAAAATEGSKEWKTVQDVLLASQKQADEFSIKLGELSNKKYEIDVKAIVDLKTAELEANTQRIQAAFQATSDVVASLAKGVTDLWALFSDKAGFEGGDELAAAAFRMEDRLDRELELKREMTDAVVEKLRAESFRLNSGEPLISIDARELAPELELVFDKILKYTQVKATQQGLSLLVGL